MICKDRALRLVESIPPIYIVTLDGKHALLYHTISHLYKVHGVGVQLVFNRDLEKSPQLQWFRVSFNVISST